jgi:16S rRNA (cytosine967-C5)-methyltransferase
MATARAVALHALVELARGHVDRLRDGLVDAGLSPRDQAFAFELAHGVARRRRLIDHVLTALCQRGLPKDPRLLDTLRLGVHQLLFVRGMPAHAAVHETVELVRGNRGFANAVLRRVADTIDDRPAADPLRDLPLGPERCAVLPAPLPADELARLAIVHSLPDWLLQRVAAEHGMAGARAVAEAASASSDVFLRFAAAVDAAALRAELAAAGVELRATAHPLSWRWSGGESPFATAAFRRGDFLVQDPTALAAAEAVPCGPGDVVVDLCAAPGAKTARLAERVRQGGMVVAYDVASARRAQIAENVARLRLADVVRIAATPAELPAAAAAVLADVPCSNSGVLGRRVEARDRLLPETFAQMAALQRPLLLQALALCRPGGAVVYSTCSIDGEENSGVVRAVLADAQAPRATLVSEATTLPQAGAHDGGYVAVLRREA